MQDDAEIPFRYELEVDRGYQSRSAAALFWFSFRRIGVILGCFALVLVGLAIANIASGTWLIFVVLAVVYLLGMPFVIYAGTLRRLRIQAPVGTRTQSGFGPHAVRLKTGGSESVIDFADVAGVQSRGEFVYLKLARGGRTLLFSSVIFPADEVEAIQAALRVRSAS